MDLHANLNYATLPFSAMADTLGTTLIPEWLEFSPPGKRMTEQLGAVLSKPGNGHGNGGPITEEWKREYGHGWPEPA